MTDRRGASGLVEVADEEWDAFLQNCLRSHHEQSSRYAANRVKHGFQCDRAIVRNGGTIVGGVQVLVQPSPVGRFARVFRGPITIGEDPQLMRLVVRRLEEVARAQAYASMRIDLFPDQDVAHDALREVGFEPTLAWYREKESYLIPLALSKEELMGRMDRKVSYYARRATRIGVIVRAGEEALLEDFYQLHQKTASYQGFRTFPRDYFSFLWDHFGQVGKVQLFIAYHDGEPLSAVLNPVVGRRMYYGWGGMRRDAEAKKKRANYLLHMTAAEWAREHGCSHYDLSGVQQFKKQFAIETIQWPRPLRKLYGSARGLRWRLLELSGSSPVSRRVAGRAARWCGTARKTDMPW